MVPGGEVLTILDLDDYLLQLVARKLTTTADLAALRLTHRRLEAAVAVRVARLTLDNLHRMPGNVYELQRLAVKFPHLTHCHATQHSKQLPWGELFAVLCSLNELTSLTLIGWEDWEVLSDVVKLPGICNLCIHGSRADAAGLRPLSCLTQLTSLTLHSSFKGTGGDALLCLNGLVHLKKLNVWWEGDPLPALEYAAGIEPLGHLTQLTSLTLFSDVGVIVAVQCICLIELIHLRELNVSWADCQGHPLSAFPNSLTKLELNVLYIPDDVDFGAGLTQLAHLQELKLYGELSYSESGFVTALSRLAQLTFLDFQAMSALKYGALAVLKDCFALRLLTISVVKAEALLDVSHTPGLKALHIEMVEPPEEMVDFSGLLDLSRVTTLTSICLGDNNYPEGLEICLTQVNSMKFLRAMLNLRTLSMYGCKQVSSSVLYSLVGLSQLARLDLPDCHGMSPEPLLQLKAMTSLTRLDLSRNLWVQTEFASVLTALSALVELDLSRCSELSEGVLQYLQGMSNLRQLNLSDNDWLGKVGLRIGLTGLGSLETLYLDRCQNVIEADLLYACDRLRLLELGVHGLDLSDAGRLRLQGPVGVCKVSPPTWPPNSESASSSGTADEDF